MALVFFVSITFLLSVFSCPPWQADAPKTGLIPESDAVGVTVVLITCTYRGQEFIRIGYYVNNEYTDPELRENPPLKPDYAQVRNMHTFGQSCLEFLQWMVVASAAAMLNGYTEHAVFYCPLVP